eukprot:Skav200274  [mRNA]  locus=scaffold93:96944:110604:- [translate_table: standard]
MPRRGRGPWDVVFAKVTMAKAEERSCLLGSPHLNLKLSSVVFDRTGQVKLADLGFEGTSFEASGKLQLLLWLQGGGDCGTQETCDERWSNSRYLMSTAELPAEIQLDGFLGSSDSWLGRRVERVHGYYFQGAHILRAVLRAVLPRLRSAPRLAVLGGCSAGGRGAFYNLDSWCSMLPSTSSCRGLLDAAWWVPDAGPLENGAANGIELWKADLWPCTGSDNDSETPSSLDESGHLCMFGATWAQHVKTPYLVHEEQFDHFMLSRRAVHRPVVSWSSNAWRSAEALRDAVRNSFQDALTGAVATAGWAAGVTMVTPYS